MNKDRALDGLRGVAAVTVFFSHFILTVRPLGLANYFTWVARPDAVGGIAESILAVPVISALWNGRFAVCIFFVLSGHVLTRGYFASGDANIIRSLAARRYTRLGIPVLASTMFAFALYAMGLYRSEPVAEITKSVWLVNESIGGHPSFVDALGDGLYGVILQGHKQFNTVFWTMRIEFIGSMLIFIYALLAWPGRKFVFAAAIYIAAVMFFAPTEWPYYLAFLIGSAMGGCTPTLPRWLGYALCVAALVLASVDTSDHWALLKALPFNYEVTAAFWSVVAGAMIFFVVRAKVFDRILTGRLCQFLGRISYPLYLVHAPIIMTLGCWVFLGMQGVAINALATGAAFVASLVATLVAAVVFETYVDQPAIRFGKWLTKERTASTRAISGGPRQLESAAAE